jgi:glycine cleavage system H lipoate-binding protein
MKTRVYFLISLLLTLNFFAYTSEETEETPALKLYTAPGLEQLVTSWSAAYASQDLGATTIEFLSPDDGVRPDGISFLFGDQMDHEISALRILTGREVVVPVINAENPLSEIIQASGISVTSLTELFKNPGITSWNTLTGQGSDRLVKIHINTEVPEIITILQKFLGIEIATDLIEIHEESKSFLDAMLNEKNAVGFCRLTDILSPDGESFTRGLMILPLDRNNNGRLDPFEMIYDDPVTFARAIWIGKYPRILSRNIFAAVPAIQSPPEVMQFNTWLLSEGQKVLGNSGYTVLTGQEVQTNLRKLNTPAIEILHPGPGAAWSSIVFAIIAFMVIFVLLVTWIFKRRKAEVGEIQPVEERESFNTSKISVPGGLFYDTNHSWAFMENNGNVKVGVDDFLRNVLGKVSRIGLKPVGARVIKGEPLTVLVRDGKKVVLSSPVSGTVVERNMDLDAFPRDEDLAKDWFYSIIPSNWKREMEFLFMADQYKIWLKDEFSRLKGFLEATLQKHAPQFVPVVMQYGGELAKGFMAELGPEIWEDFQNEFLDNSPYTGL